MKVCLVLEGAYPYVAGGMSSWTHQLITSLPEVEFALLTIMPEREGLPKIRYELSPNVCALKTIFLEDFKGTPSRGKSPSLKLDKYSIQAVEHFLSFDDNVDWHKALSILSDPAQVGTAVSWLKSKEMWDFYTRFYEYNFPDEEFNRYYWTMVSMHLTLVDMLQREGLEADLYHPLSTGYAGLLALVNSLRHRKPLLLTEHGIYAREREEEIINAPWVHEKYKHLWIHYFYFVSSGVYQHASRIVSLFARNRDIQISLGADPAKSLVIPNGVDLKKHVPRKPHKGVGTLVGALLRVTPIKDVKTLIRAFKIVHQNEPDAKLQIIGPYNESPEYYQECRRLISMLNLSEHVGFTGAVSVLDYLPLIDVLVLTSISEGQPLVLLEAMATAVPCVATDVGGCRELLLGREGETLGRAGLVVNPSSPVETAQAVLTLLRDPELRQAMGNVGRIRVETHYRQEDFIASYGNLYRHLSGQERKSLAKGAR